MADLNALSLTALLQQVRSMVRTTSIPADQQRQSYRPFQTCYKPVCRWSTILVTYCLMGESYFDRKRCLMNIRNTVTFSEARLFSTLVPFDTVHTRLNC